MSRSEERRLAVQRPAQPEARAGSEVSDGEDEVRQCLQIIVTNAGNFNDAAATRTQQYENRTIIKTIEAAVKRATTALAAATAERTVEGLERQLAQWLHLKLAAAQNLPYEDGDTCDECVDEIRAAVLPLLAADRQPPTYDSVQQREQRAFTRGLELSAKHPPVIEGLGRIVGCYGCSWKPTNRHTTEQWQQHILTLKDEPPASAKPDVSAKEPTK